MSDDAGQMNVVVPLQGLFDLTWLYNEEADYEYVFAIGHHDLEEAQRQAVRILESDKSWSEWDDPHRIVVEAAYHSTFWNDRCLAEISGSAWYVVDDSDLDPEWQSDEINFLELCEIAEKDDEGCVYCGSVDECDTTFPDGRCRDPERLRDDWPELVRANPDHFTLAPIGPFPGTIIMLQREYLEDGELEAVRD